MLKIYGRSNSLNVRKVLWLCGDLNLAFEREDWGRDFRPTSDPDFMRLSIYGVVPVIDDDGFILRESNTIVRYLCGKHGRTDLYPADLKQRALVEMWMDYGSVDFGRGMPAVFQGMVLGLEPYANPAMIAWGKTEWNRQAERLERHLAQCGPYMMGERFTIADIPIGVMVHRWCFIEFEKPDLPAVRAYYERLSERPGFRQHVRTDAP